MRVPVGLIAALQLPLVAQASWLTLGGHTFRSSQLIATIPTPADSPSILSRSHPAGDTATLLAPLYIGSDLTGDSPVAVVVDSFSCTLLVIDASPGSDFGKEEILASFQPSDCGDSGSGDRVSAPLAADPTGSRVILTTAQGRVFAVDVKPSSATFGQALWPQPFVIPSLTDRMTTSPLVTGLAVWISGPQSQGNVYRLDLQTGANMTIPSQPCFASASDIVLAPITQLTGTSNPPVGPNPTMPNTYVAVTSQGCLFELTEGGEVSWRLQPSSTDYASSAQAVLSPAVDALSKRAYFASPDGYFCCATSLGVWPCTGWSKPCVSLGLTVASGASIVGSLAISPRTSDFHGGQIFAFDSSGVLYAVMAANGAVVTAGTRLVNGVSGGPIVIPEGMGPAANILAVVSHDAVAYTVYVGDENAADDDSADDDDSVGNDGFAWGLTLSPVVPTPTPTATAMPSPPVLAGASAAVGGGGTGVGGSRSRQAVAATSKLTASSGFAVTDDGRIIAPLSDGSLVVVGAKTLPPSGVPLKTIIAVSTTVGLLVLLALGLTLWFACRHRCRKNRHRDAMLLAAAQTNGGPEGIAGGDDGTAEIDPFLLQGMEDEDGEGDEGTDPASFGQSAIYSPPGQWAPPTHAIAAHTHASINP